jgi:hypothetical protein
VANTWLTTACTVTETDGYTERKRYKVGYQDKMGGMNTKKRELEWPLLETMKKRIEKVAENCLRMRGVDKDASYPPRAKFARGPLP